MMVTNNVVVNVKPMDFPWQTNDPFLFCVYHADQYPMGNDRYGPTVSLAGRNIGQDFTIKDGWRMYHGREIPGFPAHPHRGFETVTIVRKGFVDHSDSLGAAGRFGDGDVQWMTAGKGVQHCEMFPLLNKDKSNPLELFQIWLNLPRSKKSVTPHFSMLWKEAIPLVIVKDDAGIGIEVNVIAGLIGEVKAPSPAPNSWAADPANEVAIWTIKIPPHGKWRIPVASIEVNRALYFYQGESMLISGQKILPGHVINLRANQTAIVENGSEESYFLLLQGRPIGEPVVQYGPFVVNTQAEVYQTMEDYQKNQFGGWPWPSHENVHREATGRFAKYPDGTMEIK